MSQGRIPAQQIIRILEPRRTFDNDKVELWYGDATKSLVMLPNDYLGSFDMVVVDLSETVMSLTVRDKLDVIETLNEMLSSDAFIDITQLRNVVRVWVHHVQYNN